MLEVMKIALAGMQQDAARMATIGRNVANVSTPGYRRQVSVAGPVVGTTQSFESHLEPRASVGAAQPSGVQVQRTFLMVDQAQGALKSTGRSLDLAIAGSGYFVVQTPTGNAYTRDGQFKRDAVGRLTNQQGYPVQATGGDVLLDTLTDPQLDTKGALITGLNDNRQMLRIVGFASEAMLRKRPDGLLESTSTPTELTSAAGSVRQGYLEQSNVELLNETVNTMQTMRHFESMHRVLQIADDLLGTGIKKLGEF